MTDEAPRPSQLKPERRCDDCGLVHPKELMLVKRVSWYELGVKGRYVKTRAVKWQCRPCAAKDPDWLKPEGSVFIRRGGRRGNA